MNQETKDYIKQLTYSIRELCSISGPINDIKVVIDKMDGKIKAVECSELTHNGRIIKRGDDFVIRYLEQLDNPQQINWIIARTLGHIVLHLGWETDLKRWKSLPDGNFYVNPNPTQYEQAELFAMELLLPQDILESMFEVVTGKREELGFDDLDILAEYFMVPTIKIFQRLIDLELIE